MLKKQIIWFLTGVLCLSPAFAFATMQSQSYVIHDNAMHIFDGPVISGIAHSVSGQEATVTWTTDQLSDAFVEYSIDSGFSNSKEQGISLKNATSHSVVLKGLEASTVYYYRVKSTRINGGETISTPSPNIFTTGSAAAPEPEPETAPVQSGGGGVLIIDKTDKIPPVISDLSVTVRSDSEVQIRWKTDEDSSSFVEYGQTSQFGGTYGSWSTSTVHEVILPGLEAAKQYHLRAISSDGWGNLGYSEPVVFSTKEGIITDPEEIIPDEEQLEPEEEEDTGLFQYTAQNIFDFLRRLFPELSLNSLSQNPIADLATFADLEKLAPLPVMSGEPRVTVQAEQATIYWITDIPADSQVAIAPEAEYRSGAAEPYQQVVGNTQTLETEHEVTVYGLRPNTVYHYQLRSKSRLSGQSRSRDFTFTTMGEDLRITSFFPQIIDAQTAVFKWVTNKSANSSVTFTPYRNGVLAVEMTKTVKDNAANVIHEVKIGEFNGGIVYNILLVSEDDKGNQAIETLPNFSTAPDDAPPEVSHIKADSTVFLDRNNKTQTIISWLTNEPATSRIYYQEGVHAAGESLKESTELNENYTKEHVVVITKFRSGVVYTFRVESTDSGGNTVLSKPHTLMTAKKKESIFQIIMNILENTFGWMKKLVR